jgi:hypothetical protein
MPFAEQVHALNLLCPACCACAGNRLGTAAHCRGAAADAVHQLSGPGVRRLRGLFARYVRSHTQHAQLTGAVLALCGPGVRRLRSLSARCAHSTGSLHQSTMMHVPLQWAVKGVAATMPRTAMLMCTTPEVVVFQLLVLCHPDNRLRALLCCQAQSCFQPPERLALMGAVLCRAAHLPACSA